MPYAPPDTTAASRFRQTGGQLRGYYLAPRTCRHAGPDDRLRPLRHLVKTTRAITHSASGGYASGPLVRVDSREGVKASIGHSWSVDVTKRPPSRSQPCQALLQPQSIPWRASVTRIR